MQMSHDTSPEVELPLVYQDSVTFQLFILNKIYDEYGVFARQMTY